MKTIPFGFSVIAVTVALFCPAFAEPAPTMYVDGNVAASGNGLSWETAFKTIQEAHSPSNVDTHRLILIRGDQRYYINETLSWTRGGASPTERKILRGVPGTNGMGRLPILTGATPLDESAFTPVGETHPNVYQAAYAGSVGALWEGPPGGEWGDDWTLYANQSNLDAVQANPGSRWLSAGTLYVQTTSGAHPENFILKAVVSGHRFDISASFMSIENLAFRHMWDTTVSMVGSPHRTHIGLHSNVLHSGNNGIRINSIP